MGRVEYSGGIVYIINLGLLGSKMVILLVSMELYIDWNHLNGRKSVVAFDAIAFLALSHNYVTQLLGISLEIPSRDEPRFWGRCCLFLFS